MPPFNPLAQIMPGLTKKPLVQGPLENGADLYNFQGALADETFDRGFQAERAGAPPNEIDALKRLFLKQSQDRMVNPITAQQQEYDDQMGQQRSALNEGFGGSDLSPNPLVARNMYKRQMAQEQMRQPIQEAEMRERGATQRANIQADSQKYTADTQYDINQMNADALSDRDSNFRQLQSILQANGQPLAGVTLPSKSGGGSFRFQAPVNQNSANNQFAVANQNLAKAGGSRYLDLTDTSPQQAAWNQMAQNFISQAPLDPDSKQAIIEVMSDPKSSQLPIEQLFDVNQMSPAEHKLLVDLFIKLRGF